MRGAYTISRATYVANELRAAQWDLSVYSLRRSEAEWRKVPPAQAEAMAEAKAASPEAQLKAPQCPPPEPMQQPTEARPRPLRSMSSCFCAASRAGDAAQCAPHPAWDTDKMTLMSCRAAGGRPDRK